jgi:hypothetical protein
VGKSRASGFDVEDAAILSLVVSFSLILLTIFGWSVWTVTNQFWVPLSAAALMGIP